jgi:hypothetical protein
MGTRLHVFRNRLAHHQRVWSHAPEKHYEDLLVLAGYIDLALPIWIAAMLAPSRPFRWCLRAARHIQARELLAR